MKNVLSAVNIITYKLLDYLKQESPFWWAIVQLILWGSFGLISTNLVDFKGEDVFLVLLGGLISGVGSRTTYKLSKLSKASTPVSAESFKSNVESFTKQIEQTKLKISEQSKQSNQLIVKEEFLPEDQYFKETTEKKFIVLHHTAGGDYKGTINYWLSDKQRVGTHYLIDRDGTIVQTIPLDYWAHHLYVGAKSNKVSLQYKRNDLELNKSSISIELCNYGQLTKKPKGFVNIYQQYIEEDRVEHLDKSFRGQEYFEKYSSAQIESLKNLLIFLGKQYNIPFNQNYEAIFDINNNALTGVPGIYAHVSFRTTDKWDVYPSKDLLKMLKELQNE